MNTRSPVSAFHSTEGAFVCAYCKDQEKPTRDLVVNFTASSADGSSSAARYHEKCLLGSYAADPESVVENVRAALGVDRRDDRGVEQHVARMLDSSFGIGTGIFGRKRASVDGTTSSDPPSAKPAPSPTPAPSPAEWAGLRFVGSVEPAAAKAAVVAPPKVPDPPVSREPEDVRSYVFRGAPPRGACRKCRKAGGTQSSTYVVFSTSSVELWFHKECATEVIEYRPNGGVPCEKPVRLFAIAAREFLNDRLCYPSFVQNISEIASARDQDNVFGMFRTGKVSTRVLIAISDEMDAIESKTQPAIDPTD